MDIERDFGVVNRLEPHSESVNSRTVHPVMKDAIERKVRLLLEERKVYLDPTMSLQKLSAMTSTNTTYLSNTVNDCFGCNFRLLLNRYRVNQAKQLISQERGLLKDMYKNCGFLSRSAFYSAFKAITGVTPMQYLKQNISDNDSYWK